MGSKMVSAAYDHIVAILVVGAVFVGAVVVLPNMSFNSFKAVDQQQLRSTGLSVFNAMLLDTGEPTDWGSMDPFFINDARVTRFGLARSWDGELYVLDPDKVQRLVLGNPLNYCDYQRIRGLLGLEEYGFDLRILPPFNVTNLDGTPIPAKTPLTIDNNQVSYSVRVSYLTSAPIPNALVSAKLVFTYKNNGVSDFGIISRPQISTDALGVGGDSITLPATPDSLTVILRVTVADVATLVVTFGMPTANNIAEVNFVGDSIVLTQPDVVDHASRWVYNIIPITGDGDMEFLYNGSKTNDNKFTWGEGYQNWTRTFYGLRYRDPVIFILNVLAVPQGEGGRQEVIVAGPYQNFLGFTIFQYGGSNKGSRAAVTLQRNVMISDMTYIAELTLWKE